MATPEGTEVLLENTYQKQGKGGRWIHCGLVHTLYIEILEKACMN